MLTTELMAEELDEHKHLKGHGINIEPADNEEEEEKKDIREGSVDLDELYKNELWYLSTEDISNYNQFFIEADLNKDGFISGFEANKFFEQATLNRKQLSDIWTLCDYARNGKLSESMFYVMFHIFYKISKSENAIPIPNTLPKCLTYEIIEKMRLNWQLNISQNKEKALDNIQKFKDEQNEKQRKKREEMLQYIGNKNRNIPKVLTKEEKKEQKRIILSNLYDFNHRNWYFNDILGASIGPYNINELIESWKNNEIDYNTSLWKTNQRYKTEQLSTHIELYEYISLFEQYKWYYKSNNIYNEFNINGPFFSYQMKRYCKDGTIDKNTQIRREPSLNKYENENINTNESIYISFDSIYVYDIWSKTIIQSDYKSDGFLIQDTATMFLHNLCYYYFGISIYFDSINKYNNDTLQLISQIVIGLCIFETLLISLGQFELKERLIPFDNLLMPIAVIQSILEWVVNLPIIILQIYYLYFIKWNKDIFNNEINNSIYISFVAYILHNLYKIGVIHFHHYDEFIDNNNNTKNKWKCCNMLQICNWVICVPLVLIIFGAVFFNNNNNDYTLSLVLVILGSVSCCCLTCIASVVLVISGWIR